MKEFIYHYAYHIGGVMILVGLIMVGYAISESETQGDRIADNCEETGLYGVIDNSSRTFTIYDCKGSKIVGPAGEWKVR